MLAGLTTAAAAATATALEASCYCGAVRLRVAAINPLSVSICHCTTCRRLTGAPFLQNLMLPADALTMTSSDGGEPALISQSTSKQVTRQRCASKQQSLTTISGAQFLASTLFLYAGSTTPTPAHRRMPLRAKAATRRWPQSSARASAWSFRLASSRLRIPRRGSRSIICTMTAGCWTWTMGNQNSEPISDPQLGLENLRTTAAPRTFRVEKGMSCTAGSNPGPAGAATAHAAASSRSEDVCERAERFALGMHALMSHTHRGARTRTHLGRRLRRGRRGACASGRYMSNVAYRDRSGLPARPGLHASGIAWLRTGTPRSRSASGSTAVPLRSSVRNARRELADTS